MGMRMRMLAMRRRRIHSLKWISDPRGCCGGAAVVLQGGGQWCSGAVAQGNGMEWCRAIRWSRVCAEIE